MSPLSSHPFVICLIVIIIIVVIFEVIHLKWIKNVSFQTSREILEEDMEDQKRSSFFNWNFVKRILLPYFNNHGILHGEFQHGEQYIDESHNKHFASTLVIILIILILMATGIVYIINILISRYWDAIEKKNYSSFTSVLFTFVIVAIIHIFLNVYSNYLKSIFLIEWRQYLTRKFQLLYLSGLSYYHMSINREDRMQNNQILNEEARVMDEETPLLRMNQSIRIHPISRIIDNPDQRIQVDVQLFTSTSVELFFGLISSSLILIVFLPLLFSLSPMNAFGIPGLYIPGWLLYISLIYAIVGAILTHLIGNNLVVIEYGLQQTEADFRSDLIRIGQNGETVALGRFESAEHRRLVLTFSSLKAMIYENLFVTKKLSGFEGLFNYIGDIFPIFLLAPSFFSGDITLGVLTQSVHALKQVVQSLRWFSSAYTTIIRWSSSLNRLVEFEDYCLKYLNKQSDVNDNILTSNAPLNILLVKPPFNAYSDHRLSAVISSSKNFFMLYENEWIIITGPEGSGKSTFVKSLVNVWPWITHNDIENNSPYITSNCIFISNTRNVFRYGSLLESICYPLNSNDFHIEQIVDVLDKVGLFRLIPFIHVKDSWFSRLSSGECQRLEIANCLLRNPRLVILDESVSHVGANKVSALLSILKKEGKFGLILITHRSGELNMDDFDRCYVMGKNGLEQEEI